MFSFSKIRLEEVLLHLLGAFNQFPVRRLVLLNALIPVFQHQSLLMTEVPDRAIYELFQYRCQVFWRFSIRYSMIENIENIHQFAVIFIDLVNPDTQYVPPNDIFHSHLLYGNTNPDTGLDNM